MRSIRGRTCLLPPAVLARVGCDKRKREPWIPKPLIVPTHTPVHFSALTCAHGAACRPGAVQCATPPGIPHAARGRLGRW